MSTLKTPSSYFSLAPSCASPDIRHPQYASPEGESARIVYQCLCGEGFRPLTNEGGGCDFCPLGTHRPFVTPDDGSGTALADSCLSCPTGTYGDVESEISRAPTCHLCPKNTHSDKVNNADSAVSIASVIFFVSSFFCGWFLYGGCLVICIAPRELRAQ